MRATSRVRRQAGTASVEIVVMLPVMIVLFAAVYHFYALGRAELTTSQSARACLWQYTMSGCRGGVSLCGELSVRRGGKVEEQEPGLGKEPEPEDTRYKHAKESSKSILERAEEIPLVKQVVELLFGEVASASATLNVQKFRSEEESRISNDLYLVCNTVSESWSDKIKESICDLIKELPGC